ncbi:unnamed protein product [Brachionus calyciflorus]|uniref:Uncharacterized protein n=1 Tax=Brachionus calyciflorus TaxID=104777 RepID=A0A813M8U9_9BILA|nr:unnamed protein product [Brachionus calyciflorus]
MGDITNENFEIKFHEINYNISKANYIAIDTEFTGLHIDEFRPSLTDSAEERYQKLKKPIQTFNVIQFGLSTFRYCNEQRAFITDTYNFYLFPRLNGLLDHCYSHQVSCVDFLCKHEFDFNKLYYQGISYLNTQQEKQLEKKLKNQIFFAGVERDVDERKIQRVCSAITDWLLRVDDGEFYEIERIREISDTILHNELRKRFGSIWTHQDGNKIIIEKITDEKRQEYEATQFNDMTKMTDSHLGFTKIFRLLVQYKKPLVVHNGIMDLMYLYEKFHDTLPSTLKKFKEEINKMFPLVYDTKFIGIEAKKINNQMRDLYDSTILDNLFQSLNREMPKKCGLFLPTIKHSKVSSLYSMRTRIHEAGYDAFMCGSVFLKLAHALVTYDSKKLYSIRQNNMNDYFVILKPFANKLPIIKASIDYINLSGKDSHRQDLKTLFIKSKTEISAPELNSEFTTYGQCELKMCSKYTATVTMDSICYSKYSAAPLKNNNYEITEYNFWKHGIKNNNLLYTAAAIGGFGLIILYALKI